MDQSDIQHIVESSQNITNKHIKFEQQVSKIRRGDHSLDIIDGLDRAHQELKKAVDSLQPPQNSRKKNEKVQLLQVRDNGWRN